MGLKQVRLVGTSTLGPKGQVVIPAEIREKMSIEPGDKLIALYIEDKQAVGFVTEKHAQEIVNKLGDRVSALQNLLVNRRKED